MIKRLLFGLVFGLFVGAIIAVALVKGLGILAFAGTSGAVFAYLFAAVTGVVTGLVAGKPIWASGGQIEAGLKAFFGALLSAGLMFVLRRWIPLGLDLSGFGMGPVGATEIGYLPAAALPLIAGLLASFYEADNTPEAKDGKEKDKEKRDSKAGAKVRVADEKEKEKAADLEEEEADAKKASK